MNEDSLRYLILSEGGATALLATALAKPKCGVPTAYQAAIWRELAKRLGLKLSDAGPRQITVEDGNLDLVLLWDTWTIVFEVKVRSGSVREGQLQEYYDLLRSTPNALGARFPGTTNLCLAFVTPTRVGAGEFESLAVVEPDRKAHLPWEGLLADIVAALDCSNDPAAAPTFFEELLRAGVARIGDLLREIKNRSVVEVTDERRLARRQFALDVKALVVQRQPEWASLFRPLWTAPAVEEVYLSLDPSRRANIYFTVFSESIVLPDEQGPSSLRLRLWFKVSNKHRTALRSVFLGLDRSAILVNLTRSRELLPVVDVDNDWLGITFHSELSGLRSDLVTRCAAALEQFVATFQAILP